jgi:GTP cyclohydrolase I
MRVVDRAAAERAIRAFLEALGYETSTAELAETPKRVTEAFASELLAGEQVDLAALVRDGSDVIADAPPGLVLVRDVPVTCICPHHLMPAVGKATVAYLPGKRLLGLGAITRLVDAAGRRLALQEAVGQAIVSALVDHAGARGACCRLELLHTCLAARDGTKPDTRLVTVSEGGALKFVDVAAALTAGSAA